MNIIHNSIRKTSAVIVLTLLITACNKTPKADFSTDKNEYSAGETVELTNKSEKAKSYFWTMPDGQTSDAANIKYTLNTNTAPGMYKFKLKAISRKGDKSNEAIKYITVK
jgi:PKD repeat protein